MSSPDSFRVAALILAHKNLPQVMRLISRLSHEDVDVYVHLDKKFKLTTDQFGALCSLNGGRVYIAEERQSIELFSYAMVEATLGLLRQSTLNDSYRYFMLLSGQDYPIRAIADILFDLRDAYPAPSIDVTLWHEENWVHTTFSKVYSGPFRSRELRSRINRGIRARVPSRTLLFVMLGVVSVPFYMMRRVRQLLRGTPESRMRNLNLEMAGGSQWWILPDEMVSEVLLRAQDSQFTSVFHDVGSSDESFFQSALVNSPLAGKLTINSWNETRQMSRTFTDFYGGSQVSSGHPIMLTTGDFARIMSSGFWFARKFDMDRDPDILDMIDSHLSSEPARGEAPWS